MEYSVITQTGFAGNYFSPKNCFHFYHTCLIFWEGFNAKCTRELQGAHPKADVCVDPAAPQPVEYREEESLVQFLPRRLGRGRGRRNNGRGLFACNDCGAKFEFEYGLKKHTHKVGN